MAEMTKGYCVDSDILIDYLRGMVDARSFLLEAGRGAALYISAVSIAELYAGKETRHEEKRIAIERFLANFQVIAVDASLARAAGELRRDYAGPFADMIIAASARAYNLTLATRNIKHFLALQKGAGLVAVKPY